MRLLFKVSLGAILGAAAICATLFVTTRMWQRWDIDPKWADTIIVESQEIQKILDDYRSANGEFPLTLNHIEPLFQQPTDFYDRRSQGRWHYRRLNKTDYQLFATGASFVSSFDAMIFRYSGRYPENWFRALDSSHSKRFGDWRYITGFSSFEHDL